MPAPDGRPTVETSPSVALAQADLHELEVQIAELMEAYEARTGVTIEYVSIDRSVSLGGRKRILDIRLDARLRRCR